MNTAPVRSALARKTGLDARTVAGLAAMILFFIVSGSITYFNVRVLVEDSARIQHSHTVIRSIDDLLSRVQDAETGQRGYLLTGHDRYLEPYRAAVAGLPAQLDEVASLIAGNPEEVARMIVLRRHIRDKFAELAETIELRRTSGVAPALTVLNSDRGKIEMDAIREQLGLMLQEESRLRGEGIAAMAGAYRVVWLTIALTGLVGILLAIAIGALVRRVALERDRRDWLLSGRIELGGAVLGDLGVGQLGDNILAFLARFLGAEAGAIFIGDGNNYRRIATYGVPSDAGIVQNFARGEGVLGQVVTDDAPTVLSDVPEGYLTIGSALGRDRPRHLAIAPAHADGVVQGVVELGFLHRIDDRALELLTESAGAIGIALRSARYRGELQNLLEETQRQSEELQVQSEELRVSNEELEEQSRALRDSQGRLEQQQAELEQTNVQLEEQAQQLEAQRDDLARSNASVELKARELEQASRYKSDFLANMSHELRTPLNSLLILSKLLGDNAEDNLSEEQVNYARTIHSSGNDLLGLINDILDLSKIEAGHVQIRPETVALERLVTDLRPLFQPVADERHLQFEIAIAPDCPPTMDTDRQRLEQILKNLLSNAFKFTAEGSVRLTIARAGDDRLAFAVTDTGIGIPAEQQRGIFEAFHQADGTISRRYGGTGLGLSISRELARLLGATIALESTEGQGSSFTVTLPLGYDPALVAPRDAAQAANLVDPVAAIRQSPPARSPRPATLPRRVDDDRDGLSDARRILLVVEDDAAFAGIVRDLAREMGFQCLVAGTAEEALDLARKYRPNAVVLDVGLPDQSGLAVLDRLKRDVATRHIPVHVISGADHTQTALSLGAIGYLMKPVKHEELATVLDSLSSTLTRTMRRVLIVEDDPRQREAVGKLLASGEVETVGAGTAAECLERLKEQTFDCMVLDLNLPDATGFSLLETLRADGDHAFPPVIVYTGHDLSPEQEQRLRRYSDSIIIKGARSPERLLDEVSLFLHQVVNELPPEQQKMIQKARSRDAILEGRRILIVEDDVRNVYSLTNILEPRGAIVEIARNGREAIDALDKAAEGAAPVIDLVLMDVMMPVMDGLTATRTIREDGRWRRLPIIMLTAKAMPDDHERCIEAGANDYMAKPLDVDKLLSLVRVWMPR